MLWLFVIVRAKYFSSLSGTSCDLSFLSHLQRVTNQILNNWKIGPVGKRWVDPQVIPVATLLRNTKEYMRKKCYLLGLDVCGHTSVQFLNSWSFPCSSPSQNRRPSSAATDTNSCRNRSPRDLKREMKITKSSTIFIPCWQIFLIIQAWNLWLL